MGRRHLGMPALEVLELEVFGPANRVLANRQPCPGRIAALAVYLTNKQLVACQLAVFVHLALDRYRRGDEGAALNHPRFEPSALRLTLVDRDNLSG